MTTNTKQKLGPNQLKWVEALESGKYTQTQNYLKTSKGFCCLGVAEDIFNEYQWFDTGHLTSVDESVFGFYSDDEPLGQYESLPCASTVKTLGLNSDEGHPGEDFPDMKPLTRLNDRGTTFEEIAKIIRGCPQAYFKEVK